MCVCNFEYFQGSACEFDVRPCSSNPCLNNGTCLDYFSKGYNLELLKMKNTFQCVCNKYFEGAYCEAKINVCQNETCSSHGNCVDLNNEPKCECFNLYEGDKCETATSTLQTIKTVVSVSSLIAIGVVIGFYMGIILMDLAIRK